MNNHQMARSARQPYKPREPGSLKDAVALLVVACGGQRASAELTRVGAKHIARYTDDSDKFANTHMPVDIVLALEAHCGQPIVTRFLAAAQHRALLELELPKLAAKPSETLAHVAEEGGRLLADAARAIENNRFDAKRVPKVRRECLETMSAICALHDALPPSDPSKGET